MGVLVFYPMAAAFLIYIIGRFHKLFRDYAVCFVAITEFLLAINLFLQQNSSSNMYWSIQGIAGFGLHFTMDGFRSIYVCVAAFCWMVTTLFSKEYFKHYHNRNRYYMFVLLTLGATMGVFLSADLFTTFLFFELMSFTSYVWVAHDEKKPSLRAAETYLTVAVIGGMVMLMGLFLLYHSLGTLEIAFLYEAASGCESKGLLWAASICISIGFAAKAGAFPLHIWLPKAHPVAPAPASALLSGILTKTGIFGLLLVSCHLLFGNVMWGSVILLVGTVTMFLGALLALFSVDLKRTLACSSVSQIGFILIGIGMQGLLGEHNAIAGSGTILHMVNHSLIKLVLFVAAGVIFMNVHKLDINEIRGYGRKKPLLHFIFLMGALGIGGIPLWNGYISKTLLHESIVEYVLLLQEGVLQAEILSVGNMKAIEWIFLISGGITLAYMTKLYVAIFIEKNADSKVQESYDAQKKYMSKKSAIALALSSVLLPMMGCFANPVMDKIAAHGLDIMRILPSEHSVQYFSLTNIKGACISIIIGALLYITVVRFLLMKKKDGSRQYVNRWMEIFDLENMVYRPTIKVLCAVGGFFARVCDSLIDGIIVFLRKTIYQDKPLPFELKEGTLFTYYVGKFLNSCEKWLKKKFPNWKHKQHEFVHELAMLQWEYKETQTVISRTLSFGLMLFCIGFILTTIYLLSITL